MKFNKTLLVLVGSIIGCQLMVAQPTPSAPPPPLNNQPPAPQPALQQRLQEIQKKSSEPIFDLNFPGGTPAELIAAIEKSSGEQVNAVIPVDLSDMQLPPLKMKNVRVPYLFEALTAATMKNVSIVTSSYPGPGGQSMETRQQFRTSHGFRTASPGPDAVWYFYVELPPQAPLVSRFYHLDTAGKSYTVQDITTAIKTGWDLLGIGQQPTLKYHPETKLLVAVGQNEHLQLIDSVLRELGMNTDPTMRPARPPGPATAPKKDGDSSTK